MYSFWDRKKCLYVGKGKNWKRLRAYKRSVFLKYADRLKVLQVKSKSRLPSAECRLCDNVFAVGAVFLLDG